MEDCLSANGPIAWSPIDSQLGVGAVLFHRQPTELLTRSSYLLKLASRIDRLVAKEEPEDARALLAQYEDIEGLELASDPATAGIVLAENSEWLLERSGFPADGIEPPFGHSEETAAFLAEETLEDFLAALYHES